LSPIWSSGGAPVLPTTSKSVIQSAAASKAAYLPVLDEHPLYSVLTVVVMGYLF
jgi:hypothetical protein